jgi:hypothetical protein
MSVRRFEFDQFGFDPVEFDLKGRGFSRAAKGTQMKKGFSP